MTACSLQGSAIGLSHRQGLPMNDKTSFPCAGDPLDKDPQLTAPLRSLE